MGERGGGREGGCDRWTVVEVGGVAGIAFAFDGCAGEGCSVVERGWFAAGCSARSVVFGEGGDVGVVAVFGEDAGWGAGSLMFDFARGGFAGVGVFVVRDEGLASAARGICDCG